MRKGCLFRACSSKRVSDRHLHLSETHRQAGECKNFTVEQKGRFQVCPGWLEDVAIGKLEIASL